MSTRRPDRSTEGAPRRGAIEPGTGATSQAHRLALSLIERMNDAAYSGRPRPIGLRLLGIGRTELTRRISELKARARRSVWITVPTLAFEPGNDNTDEPRSPSVVVETITSQRSLQLNPVLTSFDPHVWIGPVLIRSIIVDSQIAMLSGPDTLDGAPTAWFATDGELLEAAVNMWRATMAESRPALARGETPPLSRRQVDVARAVCLGRTDSAIARHLGISERTVAREVATILEFTRSGSRSEAVAHMLGQGRKSG